MIKMLTYIATVLKRVLGTNKFTSIGATLALVGVVLLLTHHLSATDFLALIGLAVTVIGYASKDGIRSSTPVAPEDVPPMPPLPPGVAAVLLLFGSVAVLASCSIIFPPASAAPTAQHAPHFGDVRLAVALSDAALDTLPYKVLDTRPWGAVPAPYLVAPPAHLSPRERRKFLRVQQRAQRRALRNTGPAKVKIRLEKGAAYNAAPDGVAVAQKNIDAPVALGPNSPATDNRKLGQHANGAAAQGRDFAAPLSGATVAPTPSLLARAWSFLTTYWPVLLGLAVFACLGYLRIGPVGTGLRAASAARSPACILAQKHRWYE